VEELGNSLGDINAPFGDDISFGRGGNDTLEDVKNKAQQNAAKR
jgi:hypothetical protein